MKQIFQHLRTGEIELADLPAPQASRGKVVIQTTRSLISAGTERMLVEFGKANLVLKARQQPDKVKQVLDKIRTDGLLPTLEAVFSKLDQPMPLGYCNVGRVVEVGQGVDDLEVGQRVISNGPHAEAVCVPRNLVAKIPDGVSDEQAAFTVLASIALQGIRLAKPTLGERFVVYGMGLLGLITTQLLRAHGCRVLGVDLNPERLKLAEKFGAETVNIADGADPITAAEAWTRQRGADGALITAAARTDSIMHQAAQSCRKRGRIVLVGVVGLNLNRNDFYEKELSFQVSCSYGPGRYDETYEQKGEDYPYGFVRWTEQRNFQAVLETLESGALCVDDLITDRYEIARAASAYSEITGNSKTLGVILQYPATVDLSNNVKMDRTERSAAASGAGVGVIGAGGFASNILLPAIEASSANLLSVADLEAPASGHAAKKFSAQNATTDYETILKNDAISAVFIAVGHHLHAKFIREALHAGKHVFVEKPLAMNVQQVSEVIDAVKHNPEQMLMLGFNRRFSPHIVKVRELLKGRSEPLCMNMTINAGIIPPDHWVHDPQRGGGRIIGEACHFIDLLANIAGSEVQTVSAQMIGGDQPVREDKMAIVLRFSDGSVGTVNYFANGSKSYPKETLEVFSDGRVLRLENFRKLKGYGFGGFKKLRTRRQDKGHRNEIAAFANRVRTGGDWLIPLEQLINATLASFAAVKSAKENRIVDLPDQYREVFSQLQD